MSRSAEGGRRGERTPTIQCTPGRAPTSLSFQPVVQTSPTELRRILCLEVPHPAEDVAQGDHLAGIEQANAVAEIQARREVFAHGEGRCAAECVVVAHADVVDTDLRTDALGEQVSGG